MIHETDANESGNCNGVAVAQRKRLETAVALCGVALEVAQARLIAIREEQKKDKEAKANGEYSSLV